MQQEAGDQYEDDVVIVDDENGDAQMEEAQEEEQQSTVTTVSSTQGQVIGQRTLPPLQHIERQTSVTRAQLTPFVLGGQAGAFEDGEDGIVPSTPTLFVPHRGDGFAEAVSSPQIPNQRFLFGASSESGISQSELAQLESQGALRLDDTRMDLSQLDEGTGRSVPTTPLRTTAPALFTSEVRDSAPILSQATSAVISSQLSSLQQTTETETGEVQTTEQSPTEGEILEGDLGVEDTTETETGEESGEGAPETTEATEVEGDPTSKEEDKTAAQDKTDSSDKPKIQKIVWGEGSGPGSSSSSSSQLSQPPQQERNMAPRRPYQHRGIPQRGGMQPMRGRGNYPRGRSPVPRGRIMRGNRGMRYDHPF